MQREFKRVVIVNRGEAAMRFIHAAREFDRENGTSICTIALYTEPDRNAMFVREADEAVSLGTARIVDPSTNQSKSTYVDFTALKTAIARARADAVWVGWGFVAEHPGLPIFAATWALCSSARTARPCADWVTRLPPSVWPNWRRYPSRRGVTDRSRPSKTPCATRIVSAIRS